MALSAAKLAEQLRNAAKLLQFLMTHKDAAPFLEAVAWKEWGLVDYPKVIKTPMDLGLVKKKLERNEYAHPKEFKHDVNLVFNNCMTYNADGSEYYNVAAQLKKIFEERYAKTVKEEEEALDNSRPPTLVDKKMFAQNLYNISSEDLGKVVQILDQRCESCIKKVDPEDIEIDIDTIDATSFWVADGFVRDCLPGGKKGGPGAGQLAKKPVAVARPAGAVGAAAVASPNLALSQPQASAQSQSQSQGAQR